MCCAIKPTASWLLEETVSVCRNNWFINTLKNLKTGKTVPKIKL
jgi:hypothetical protein